MKSSITCGSRLIENNEAVCLQGDGERCIEVPLNICRMKPIDSATGKRLKRKFTVKKEGVEEKW